MLAIGLTLVSALAATVTGCASTPPPKELIEARRSYDRAHDGPARELVPAELHTAQVALSRAEQAFLDAPEAAETRDLAYIAQRKAMLAEARAALAAANRDKANEQMELKQMQARVGVELSQTRAEAAAQRQVLSVQQQERTAEQRARRDAEERARLAIASLEKVAAIKEEARGMVITLNGAVLFATGQSTLLPIAEDRLKQVARALADHPRGNIVVEGHTDSTGSTSMNEELSRRRAESVRERLIHDGVAPERITAVGLGPSRPVADNKSPEGRANNRRVEIIIERGDHTP